MCLFSSLCLPLSIGSFSQAVNVTNTLLVPVLVQGHSSPSWALLPPIPSNPLPGGWHTIDYCSRKTFDLNVFLSVSVKRHFTMGLLLFAHLMSRGMDCLAWDYLTKGVCITN